MPIPLPPVARMACAAIVLTLATATSAQAQATDDLVGRWGVAAYWNESDAANVVQQARSF
jgi:hypothetical protein